MNAPAWVAILPATSDIGASRGSCRAVLHGLVGDAGGAGVAQALRQFGRRGQVQVGEEQMVGRSIPTSGGWLLDAQHHLGLAEHRLRVGQDPGALGLVVGVVDRAPVPGAGLHQHLVALLRELPRARRGERHPVLVRLDLGRDSYLHRLVTSWARMSKVQLRRSSSGNRSSGATQRSGGGRRAPRARPAQQAHGGGRRGRGGHDAPADPPVEHRLGHGGHG